MHLVQDLNVGTVHAMRKSKCRVTYVLYNRNNAV